MEQTKCGDSDSRWVPMDGAGDAAGGMMVALWVVMAGLSSFSARGQVRDRFVFAHEQVPSDGKVSSHAWDFGAFERFLLDEDGESLVTVGLRYRSLGLEAREPLRPTSPYRQLYSVIPQIMLNQILDDQHGLIVLARPGFFGDLNGGWVDAFRLEGGVLATRVMSERLTLGLGVARGSNFGRDLTLPVLQVLYFPTDTIMIEGLLPTQLEAWYLPSRAWEYGALFNIVGSLYQVEESELGVNRLGYANMNLGFGLRRRIEESWYLQGEAGGTVSRRYEWSADGRVVRDVDLDPVPYVRVGFVRRF